MSNKWKVTLAIIGVLALAIGQWFITLMIVSGIIAYYSLRWLFNELATMSTLSPPETPRLHKTTLVTFRSDGQISSIMKGEDCVGFIISVANHKLDPDGWDIFKGSYNNYAAHLFKMVPIRLAEDPGFLETKLQTDADGKIILFNEKNAPVNSVALNNLQLVNGKLLQKDTSRELEGAPRLTDTLILKIEEANNPSLFERIFKTPWVGLSPYWVFSYTFEWPKYNKEVETGTIRRGGKEITVRRHIEFRNENIRWLYFNFPVYAVEVVAETGAGSVTRMVHEFNQHQPRKNQITESENVQVRLLMVLETEITNPKKALFRTAGVKSAGEWLHAIIREIEFQTRLLLGTTDWDHIISGKPIRKGKDSQKKPISINFSDEVERIRLQVNGEESDGIPIAGVHGAVREYGARATALRVINADLADQSLQTAIEGVFVARRARDKRLILAEAARAEEAAPLLGRADGYRTIDAIPHGAAMYAAEQIGAGGIKVLQVGQGGMGPMLNLPESVLADNPEKPTKKASQDDSASPTDKVS